MRSPVSNHLLLRYYTKSALKGGIACGSSISRVLAATAAILIGLTHYELPKLATATGVSPDLVA